MTYWSEPLSQPRTIMTSPTQGLTLATSSAPAALSSGGQLHVSPIVSPMGVGNVRDLSLVDPASVSPIVALMEAGQPPASQRSPIKTPSGSSIIMTTPSSGPFAADPTSLDLCPLVESQVLDDEGEEVYGSADGRQTMVTKKIVPAVVARRLVS